ncbi:MAG: hypothetical protein LAO78_11580 [Acidobacteriia bacterium]|jgi:hypothetical protein|nr:hypothetical protein [Terriglobia bacterium]
MKNNLRFFLAYIFLVGLPLSGMVGILRYGRNVAAPTGLQGTWKLLVEDSRCGPSGIPLQDITIMQSGKNLVFYLNSMRIGEGAVERSDFMASILLFPSSLPAADRVWQRKISMKGRVKDKEDPKVIEGEFDLEGGRVCGLFVFRALSTE